MKLTDGKSVRVHGFIHGLRDLGGVVFMILRTNEHLLQCILEESCMNNNTLFEGCAVTVRGVAAAENRAPGGFELRDCDVSVLSRPVTAIPSWLRTGADKMSLEAKLDLRPVLLRSLRERAVFKLQDETVQAFRGYLRKRGFVEIHSPKITGQGAEGGANVFRLPYFGKTAYLAQSPQFYKQTMAGVFHNVYETGPVFRAEKHNTARHINEYVSLDLESAFIDSFYDIMKLEQNLLRGIIRSLAKNCANEIGLLGVSLPEIKNIPRIRFDEAKREIELRYGNKSRSRHDIEPEEERLICRYALEEFGSEFVFVTHYPSAKRPFYVMNDPSDSRYTLSFDLLFRGVEITSGGQRIHDYSEQVNKIREKGCDPADFEDYLMIHKYGMPPHGGLGIGLERFLAALCGFSNVRQASLFPRDTRRLTP